jgi:hypothetical protein
MGIIKDQFCGSECSQMKKKKEFAMAEKGNSLGEKGERLNRVEGSEEVKMNMIFSVSWSI